MAIPYNIICDPLYGLKFATVFPLFVRCCMGNANPSATKLEQKELGRSCERYFSIVSCGGIFRDDKVDLVSCFAAHIGVSNALHAELVILIFGSWIKVTIFYFHFSYVTTFFFFKQKDGIKELTITNIH